LLDSLLQEKQKKPLDFRATQFDLKTVN